MFIQKDCLQNNLLVIKLYTKHISFWTCLFRLYKQHGLLSDKLFVTVVLKIAKFRDKNLPLQITSSVIVVITYICRAISVIFCLSTGSAES